MISSQYMTQLILPISCLIYILLIPSLNLQRQIFFIEKDPALSYPFANDQISHLTNLVLSITIPLILISIIKYFHDRNSEKITTPAWLLIGLLQCLSITLAIYTSLKTFIGYPRPDFFSVCNYNGYNQALMTGNYTHYDSLSHFGHKGNVANCLASQQSITYGFQSLPSGHACLSFASMTYTVFLIRFLFDRGSKPQWKWFSFSGLVSLSPLYFSVWVSFTRIQDYKHRPIDVTIGTLIGVFIAYLSWQNIVYYGKLQIKDNNKDKNKNADQPRVPLFWNSHYLSFNDEPLQLTPFQSPRSTLPPTEHTHLLSIQSAPTSPESPVRYNLHPVDV